MCEKCKLTETELKGLTHILNNHPINRILLVAKALDDLKTTAIIADFGRQCLLLGKAALAIEVINEVEQEKLKQVKPNETAH